eukprot:2463656-Pyramimonas_sp.AAC.1
MADTAEAVPAAEIDAMVDAKAAEAAPSSETSNSLSAEQQAKVKRQVEFYFSVSNLPRDKYVIVSCRARLVF